MTGLPAQDCLYKTVRVGQREMTATKGQPDRAAVNRTANTRQPERDSQDVTARRRENRT
jgi:hypothetical protein